MKKLKTILLSCFLGISVFMALPASAQFSAGIRAGANLATEPSPGYSHVFLALPYGGLFAQYKFGIPLDLQLGVNYSGEGVNLKNPSTADTYHFRQGYLAVPLFIQYRFAFGGYIEVGPQLDFLLSASDESDGGPSTNDKSEYKSTNLELGGGLGYEFKHKAANGLGINVRYLRSVSSIFIDEDDNGGVNVKNRVLSIGLTYRFGASK